MRLFAAVLILCATASGQNASRRDVPGKDVSTKDVAWYDAGTRELDSHRYEDAVRNFERVIEAKGSRADGALYWKAYALNRLGRREDALAAIAVLRRDFPNSRWLGDAQALEVQTKPVAPGDESNEELKLIAINSLMNADPGRAVPLLESVLKGSGSPRLKDRAMFVLTQSHSPEAQQVLANYAKGGANPDLQRRAIRYIGMGGTPETQKQLTDIYNGSTDVEVKREILRSLAMSGASAIILDIAKNEKNRTLRIEAIRDLSMTRNPQPESLLRLYTAETDPDVKREILNAFMIRKDSKDLVELARNETDPAMKKTIVERLSAMRNDKDATDYMMELLK